MKLLLWCKGVYSGLDNKKPYVLGLALRALCVLLLLCLCIGALSGVIFFTFEVLPVLLNLDKVIFAYFWVGLLVLGLIMLWINMFDRYGYRGDGL